MSGLAVLVGRALLRVVPLHALHYVGAAVCLLLAGIAAYELVAERECVSHVRWTALTAVREDRRPGGPTTRGPH